MSNLTMLRRLSLCIIIAVSLFGAGFLTWVYLSQDSMIFHPEPYNQTELRTAPDRAIKLKYVTSAGRQTSWYVPPESSNDDKLAPDTLWILFNGNASLALHWRDHVSPSPDDSAGFLLFEYPGYGLSEGKPSRENISEAANASIEALARHFNLTATELLAKKVRVLGYSLGAAVALEFAARNPVNRVVLAAPFTTMRAMADRIVSPRLSWLLRHQFDNLVSIEDISSKPKRPQIIIIHGDADLTVPIDMSREMKNRWADTIKLVEKPGADHANIVDGIQIYMADVLTTPTTSVREFRSD